MSAKPSSLLDVLLSSVRAFVAQWPGAAADEVRIILLGGKKIIVPVPPPVASLPAPAVFVPTPFQIKILEALDGKALRTDPLGAAVGDRGRLFKQHGLTELVEHGDIIHDARIGYYRPDAPPPELENEE